MNKLDFWRGRSVSPSHSDLYQMVEKIFEDFGRLPSPSPWMDKQLDHWNPRAEVSETKTHYNFRFDLPGLMRDDIKIELHENRLTVSGERKQEKKEEDKEKKSYLSEMSYGSYFRSFELPSHVSAEKAEAKYENGVLSIALPKASGSSARQISIK